MLQRYYFLLWFSLFLILSGCGSEPGQSAAENEELSLPALEPAGLAAGERLKVVATTSIIGDVVAQVGGEAIELTVLVKAGQDPHSYEPAAADLTAVADADVIFINGWDLEEGLVDDLDQIGDQTPLVPVSAGVTPLRIGETGAEDEHAEEDGDLHAHGRIDPHTWMDVTNVIQWVDNISQTLGQLDPARATLYTANAAAYQAELTELEQTIREQLGTIPPERRRLVTNHDSLGYFARAYDFEVIGTILPGASTVAEPSAADLAHIVEAMEAAGVCTVFAETTANPQLAQAVADELRNCDQVQLLTLHSGALGGPGSGAENYIDLMTRDVQTLVTGLK